MYPSQPDTRELIINYNYNSPTMWSTRPRILCIKNTGKEKRRNPWVIMYHVHSIRTLQWVTLCHRPDSLDRLDRPVRALSRGPSNTTCTQYTSLDGWRVCFMLEVRVGRKGMWVICVGWSCKRSNSADAGMLHGWWICPLWETIHSSMACCCMLYPYAQSCRIEALPIAV